MIRALDQAEGFNYNARRNKLTYSDYRSHNSGKEEIYKNSLEFIWFKSFHIVGIRRSYEDGILISFHSCHTTTGYIDSKTPPNHRSNLVPTHSNSSAAKKQPFSVPSPSDPTRVAQFRDDSSAEALKPHERLNKLFERLEKGHVERLQDIGKAVKSFDRSVGHLEYKGPKLNSFEVVDVFYFI